MTAVCRKYELLRSAADGRRQGPGQAGARSAPVTALRDQGASRLPYPVPAVRAVVADNVGRVLIIKRPRDSMGGGLWCLPGGKVERGEMVADALRGELVEETGLECVSAEFLFYDDSLPTERYGMHCINLYFECTVRGEVVLNQEATAHAWVGPRELGEHPMAFGHDAALRRYWNGRSR